MIKHMPLYLSLSLSHTHTRTHTAHKDRVAPLHLDNCCNLNCGHLSAEKKGEEKEAHEPVRLNHIQHVCLQLTINKLNENCRYNLKQVIEIYDLFFLLVKQKTQFWKNLGRKTRKQGPYRIQNKRLQKHK